MSIPSFTLLHGWALSLFLVIPVLILAYLRRNPSNQTIVSSLLLIRKLKSRQVIKKRIKLPLRFFLEVLALSLLVVALASPIISVKNKRVAIIIDTSLSMRALEGGQSRITKAIEVTAEILQDETNAVFSIYTSTPKLTLVGERDLSSSAALSVVKENVKAGYSSDLLSGSVLELAQSGTYDELYVVTDKRVSYLDATNEGGKEVKIIAKKVGEPTSNLAIISAKLSEDAVDQSKQNISVSLLASSDQELKGRVELRELSGSDSKEKLLTTTQITVGENKRAEVNFTVRHNVNSIYKILVVPSVAKDNNIIEDDEVFVTAAPSSATKILVVSKDGKSTLGLDKIRGIITTALSIGEYNHKSEQELYSNSLIIFHRVSPASLPEVPSLLVIPPADGKLFIVENEVAAPVISSWNENHPINSYLKVKLLNLSSAEMLQVPTWGEKIINLEQGTIAFAGEYQGIKYAVLGFEIFPFEGDITPVPTVLTLNLIKWLMQNASIKSQYLTGSVIPLDSSNWSKITPDGIKVEIQDDKSQELGLPGLYRFTNDSQQEIVIPVNAIHPEESNTNVTQTIVLPSIVYAALPKDNVRDDEQNNIWWYCILGAGTILVAEVAFSRFVT